MEATVVEIFSLNFLANCVPSTKTTLGSKIFQSGYFKELCSAMTSGQTLQWQQKKKKVKKMRICTFFIKIAKTGDQISSNSKPIVIKRVLELNIWKTGICDEKDYEVKPIYSECCFNMIYIHGIHLPLAFSLSFK